MLKDSGYPFGSLFGNRLNTECFQGYQQFKYYFQSNAHSFQINVNIKIAFTSFKTGSLLIEKDNIPKNLRAGVV